MMHKLFEMFLYLGKKEAVIEQKRQELAKYPDFEPH